MTIKNYIPNALTLANIFCGCIGTLFAMNNHLDWAAGIVAIGVLFDFLDGFFARILNAQSEIGLQLDSLADVITSGLVPGVFMYQLLDRAAGIPWGTALNSIHFNIAYLGFAITLASAYRLAKFNVDDGQSTSFKGLPTPANAIFIISLPLVLLYGESNYFPGLIGAFQDALANQYVLLGITALSCWLLNSPIRLFALKFKSFNIKDNSLRYGFLILAALLLNFLGYLGILLIIVSYILLSLIFSKSAN